MISQYSIINRPRTFPEIYGQPVVERELIPRSKDDNWPLAMLLKGSTGVGKSTAAFIIAMTLNCQNQDENGNPCQTCVSCKSIISEKFDRDTVVLDGSAFSGKDDVIEFSQIADTAPMYDKKRVLIVEEADQLSTAAKNAMLKILEKPRKNIHFILLSMVYNGIPAAIQTRCQVFNFKTFNSSELMFALKNVMETMGVWEDESIPKEFKLQGLASLASAARGSLREATQLLEKCLVGKYFTAEEIKDNLGLLDENTIQGILMKIVKGDPTALSDLESVDLNEFFNIGYAALADAAVFQLTNHTANEYFIPKHKDLIALPNFKRALRLFEAIYENPKPYLKKAYFISKMVSWFAGISNQGQGGFGDVKPEPMPTPQPLKKDPPVRAVPPRQDLEALRGTADEVTGLGTRTGRVPVRR